MKFIEGQTSYMITKTFNDEKIPTPVDAKLWRPTTVDFWFDNPVYCGYVWANKVSRSVYHMRGANTPVAKNLGPVGHL